MLKRSFLNRQEVAVALLYCPSSAAQAITIARSAEMEGADGIALELAKMPEKDRSMESFKNIISSVHLPFMFIDYRNDCLCGKDDEARQKYLLMAADAGADVIDVMGDLYDPTPGELTLNENAVAKQKLLIDTIHSKGANVLMSSHATQVFLQPEQVLEIMKAQSARGADILKVVTAVNTEKEFLGAVETMLLLRKELDKPFIYLAGGKYGRMVRYMGPKFGVAVEFGVHEYYETMGYAQPTIKSFRQVLDNLHWDMENMPL